MNNELGSVPYLEQLWDSMTGSTEVFIPVHKNAETGKVVLFIDNFTADEVGEIRAFLSENECKSYLKTLASRGVYVRYNLDKLDKNMGILKNKKPDMKLKVVLYAVDMAQHFHKVDVLWSYSIH